MNVEYLKNVKTGRVFPYTVLLAGQIHLVPCEKDGRLIGSVSADDAGENLVRTPFLRQKTTGRLYPWSDILARRSDMIPVQDEDQEVALALSPELTQAKHVKDSPGEEALTAPESSAGFRRHAPMPPPTTPQPPGSVPASPVTTPDPTVPPPIVTEDANAPPIVTAQNQPAPPPRNDGTVTEPPGSQPGPAPELPETTDPGPAQTASGLQVPPVGTMKAPEAKVELAAWALKHFDEKLDIKRSVEFLVGECETLLANFSEPIEQRA
jgi:hypothetical protein